MSETEQQDETLDFTEAIYRAYDKECYRIFKGNPVKEEMIAALHQECDSFVLKGFKTYKAKKTGEIIEHYHNPRITKHEHKNGEVNK